jgi:hypothetical protein
MAVSGQPLVPAAYTWEKSRPITTEQQAERAPKQVWTFLRRKKFFPLLGFKPQTTQSAAQSL